MGEKGASLKREQARPARSRDGGLVRLLLLLPWTAAWVVHSFNRRQTEEHPMGIFDKMFGRGATAAQERLIVAAGLRAVDEGTAVARR